MNAGRFKIYSCKKSFEKLLEYCFDVGNCDICCQWCHASYGDEVGSFPQPVDPQSTFIDLCDYFNEDGTFPNSLHPLKFLLHTSHSTFVF